MQPGPNHLHLLTCHAVTPRLTVQTLESSPAPAVSAKSKVILLQNARISQQKSATIVRKKVRYSQLSWLLFAIDFVFRARNL